MNLEENAGVADEAGGADLVSTLGEDGADEGAEVGRTIDNKDAMAWVVMDGRRGGIAQEGEDGFLLGRVRVEDGREHSDLENLGDEGRGGGQADVSRAFAEVRGIADEEAHTHAVEAGDFSDVENDGVELADGVLEG